MMDKRILRSKKGKPRNTRPYDRQNQSIFGNFCSKVKGWLFSTWSNNSEEEQPGCSTDSVQETVRDDNDIVSQSVTHGNKRLRLRFEDHIPSIQNSATQTWPEQTATQPLFESVITDLNPRVTTSQSSLLENKEAIPALNGDDHSENSEGSASTSGCSSLVSSHKDINRLVESPFQNIRTSIKSRVNQRESTACMPGLSDLNSSRPLWSGYSPSATFQRRLSNTNQPNFNLSTFMGPSKLDKSNDKKLSSPFYKGKTTFGGASALRRMPPTVTPYQVDKTLRNQIRVRETPSEDSLEGMSSAAKRILLTLEKMSSPVTDAKKMPNLNTSPVDLSLYLKPPKSRRNSQFTPSVSSKGPPIADISKIARLATLKNYGVSRLRNSTMTSPVVPSDQKTLVEDILQSSSAENNSQSNGGGKIRNKLNKQHLSSKYPESEMLNEPCLPNVPMPISNLPQFNFGSKSEKVDRQQPSGLFKFSNPIEHEINNAIPAPSLTEKSFKFSNPIEIDVPNTSLSSSENVVLPLSSTVKSVSASSTWECSECWVRNPANQTSCMACETPKIPKDKSNDNQAKPVTTKIISTSKSNSNSPMLKFGGSTSSTGQFSFGTSKTEAQAVSSQSFPTDSELKKLSSSTTTTWECNACWVRNPENKSNCMACETARLEKKTNISCNSFAPTSSSSIKDTWECQTCLIKNPSNESKCMACETPKSSGGSFTDKTTTSTSTWECSSCWVRNPMKENKCLACETLHPNRDLTGTTGFQYSSPIQNSSFKFGSFVATSTTATVKFGNADIVPISTTTTSTFKFGVPPSSAITSTFTSSSDSPAGLEMPASSIASGSKPSFTSDAPKQNESESNPADKIQSDNKTKDISPLDNNAEDSASVILPEDIVSKEKQITPSVTSCFGFATQPILDSKKSENFSISVPKEKSNSSSLTPAFSSFPIPSSNKVKVIEDGKLQSVTNSHKEVTTNTVSAPVSLSSQSESAASTFTIPSATTPIFKVGEKTETSKSTLPTTSTNLLTANKDENAANKLATVFQSTSQSPSVTSAFTIPSSTSSLKVSEKTESSMTAIPTASVSFTTANSNFTFTNTAPNNAELVSKPNEMSSVKSEPIQNISTIKDDAKTVTSTPLTTTPTTSVFSFGNKPIASSTVASSTFSFFPAVSTTAVSSVFAFGAPSTSQAPKPAPTDTTPSSVFAFGASSNPTEASKPGGFTFKTTEKSQNSASVLPVSQPAAQGLLPDSASATVPASTGGFVFGGIKTEPQSAASAPFAFGSGAPPSSSASAFSAFQPAQPPNPTFQFGQPAQSSASTFGSNNFTFGKPETANQIPSSTSQNIPVFGSTGNFSFGSKNETPSQANSASQPSTFLTPNNFTFNNKNETSTPTFGSSGMQQPVFGASPVSAFGTNSKPQGGFNFGSPVFQFGGTPNTDKKPAVPAPGWFGAPSAAPEIQTSFNINTPSNFNFGAAAGQVGAAPFQFAASSSSTDAGANQPRKYRKAVRRVTRKD